MTTTIKYRFASLCYLAIITFALLSCNGTSDQSIVVDNEESNLVELTDEQFKSSGMLLGKLQKHDFYEVVKASGYFDVPPENRASVSVYFGGYVKQIDLLPGQTVRKGQLLFTLENPEYIKIQQSFLEADGKLKYLKADFDRQKTLADENIASQKNYLKAESDYKVTLSQYQSLKKQLELMNIDLGNLLNGNMVSTIKVLAPINGAITSVNAVKGLYLSAADVAITIADAEHMHVELKVFETDLLKLKKGQIIQFKLPGAENKVFKAEVYLINALIENENRTAIVHGHLIDEKEAELFVPGMYLEAEILTDKHESWALPQSAVVTIDDAQYVLIKKGNDNNGLQFEKVGVKTGSIQNNLIAITNIDSFTENSEFLVSGAFDILSE